MTKKVASSTKRFVAQSFLLGTTIALIRFIVGDCPRVLLIKSFDNCEVQTVNQLAVAISLKRL